MGLGYYQLRLVGRYRSRRNAYLSCIVVIPSKMENGDQPFCGGDDYLLCNPGRFVPYYPHGPSLVSLLGSADPESVWFALGKLQLTIALGRVRNLNVSFSIIGILVDWIIA